MSIQDEYINPPSWLFDELPNDDHVKEFFNPENGSKELLQNWISKILGSDTPLDYSKLRAIYVSSLNRFNIEYAYTYDGINDIQRKKVVEDMTRTLCKIRCDLYPNAKAPNEKEKKLFCAILRITLSLHYEKDKEVNKFKYRQSIIELILPIYHIVWCAFEFKETYLIESLTKYLFKKFMKNTNQIQNLPGSLNFQNSLSLFENHIKTHEQSVYSFFANNNIQFLIPFKWYSLIFTQEFKFNDVIQIWIYLLDQEISKFNDNLINICIQILKKIIKEASKKKDDKQAIIQSLQDISNIEVHDIIDRSRGRFAPIKKYLYFLHSNI